MTINLSIIDPLIIPTKLSKSVSVLRYRSYITSVLTRLIRRKPRFNELGETSMRVTARRKQVPAIGCDFEGIPTRDRTICATPRYLSRDVGIEMSDEFGEVDTQPCDSSILRNRCGFAVIVPAADA